MEIRARRIDGTEVDADLIAVPVFQGESSVDEAAAGLDAALDGMLGRRIERGDVRGRVGETRLLFADGASGVDRIVLIGAGKRDAFDAEGARRAAGTAVRVSEEARAARLAFVLPSVDGARLDADRLARSVAEGAVLAAYRYTDTKSEPEDGDDRPVALESLILLVADEREPESVEASARTGAIVARGENAARRLGNLPGNVATPTYLGEWAERIATETGMRATILGPDELRAEGLEALLSVSRGSIEEPRLIVLEHRGGTSDEKPLVLVGKALTFDAGGISIKPSLGMEEMKFDMCGGAAVLGAMQAIGELGVERNVVAVVPSSENLPSGSALKPGDVIGSLAGKTIEIVNTDAEGRLILADALAYARRFEPRAIVDVATLTGACLITFGKHAIAVMGTDQGLVDALREAGERAGERAWQLPMFDEYRKQLDSEYADIKNSGGRPAGTITAGWFLREFADDMPWAHLDVAGTAWGDGELPYQRKGATGIPTRLFLEWVLSTA